MTVEKNIDTCHKMKKKKVDTTGTAPKTNWKIIETETKPQTHKCMATHSPDLSQTLPFHMLMECCECEIKWGKRTNKHLQNTMHTTKDRVTRTSLSYRYSGRVGNSYSAL